MKKSGNRHHLRTVLTLYALLSLCQPANATDGVGQEGVADKEEEEMSAVTGVSATAMFEIADRAIAANDAASAKTIYLALAEQDPSADVRNEARFRHARLLSSEKDYAAAAVLLRAILDEKPDAQPVRLELAAVLFSIGDDRGARAALRQAQAVGGLPPEVARSVDQYAAILRSLKPLGVSVELALAPSTNINRATSATTLDTIIAPFELSEDARAQSGVGLKLGGTGYARLPVSKVLRLTARLSGQGSFYRRDDFNEIVASTQIGAEAVAGYGRIRPQVGRSYRWFGGDLYATTDSVTVGVSHPLNRTTQAEVEGGIGRADYRTNDLQDGTIYDLSTSVEHAFTATTGGSITLSGQRQRAADPGYSTKSGGVGLLGWKEWGKTTLYAAANIYRLEADERLFLYPEKRKEWLYRATVGATLRRFTWREFAPIVRAVYERNSSTIAIYDYRRFAMEIGITRAF